MKTRNILSLAVAALFALALTGCYEKFDGPSLPERYDDQWFEDNGYTVVSIRTVKDLFSNPANQLINHQEPNNPVNGASPANTSTYGRYYLIPNPYVIKGKVTSNDAFGNFFRGFFMQDDEGEGIEIKVGTSGLSTKYPVGETVYVVCQGLVLGNYRSVLSLGLTPDGTDISDSGDPYPNKFMDVQMVIDRHVRRGPVTQLTSADTVVVDMTAGVTDVQLAALESRLVRFEGLVSRWVPGTGRDGGYPAFLHKLAFNTYQMYSFEEAMAEWKAFRDGGSIGTPPLMPEPQNNYFEDPQPSWGFQGRDALNTRNYGSALFTAPGYSGAGQILIRTSGYSRFALEPVTPDGTAINVTAIVARYTDRGGGNLAYQLAVNDSDDIVELD